MNTDLIKERLKTGDVLNCIHRFNWSLVGVAMFFIRLICKYDHSAIVEVRNGEVLIWDASFGRTIRPRTLTEWMHGRNAWIMVKRPPITSTLVERLRLQEGKQYDTIGVVWYSLLYQLLKRIFVNIKWFGWTSAGKADKTFWCSELVGFVLDLPKWWTLTPGNIADFGNMVASFDVKAKW